MTVSLTAVNVTEAGKEPYIRKIITKAKDTVTPWKTISVASEVIKSGRARQSKLMLKLRLVVHTGYPFIIAIYKLENSWISNYMVGEVLVLRHLMSLLSTFEKLT